MGKKKKPENKKTGKKYHDFDKICTFSIDLKLTTGLLTYSDAQSLRIEPLKQFV